MMTLGVMTIEDIPQLVLNCIYLDSRGFAGADGIAVFSFVMSLLSITSNLVILWHEQGMVAEGGVGSPLAVFGMGPGREVSSFENPAYARQARGNAATKQSGRGAMHLPSTATCAYSSANGDCKRDAEAGETYCTRHGCPNPGCSNSKASGARTCDSCSSGGYVDVGPHEAFGGFEDHNA